MSTDYKYFSQDPISWTPIYRKLPSMSGLGFFQIMGQLHKFPLLGASFVAMGNSPSRNKRHISRSSRTRHARSHDSGRASRCQREERRDRRSSPSPGSASKDSSVHQSMNDRRRTRTRARTSQLPSRHGLGGGQGASDSDHLSGGLFGSRQADTPQPSSAADRLGDSGTVRQVARPPDHRSGASWTWSRLQETDSSVEPTPTTTTRREISPSRSHQYYESNTSRSKSDVLLSHRTSSGRVAIRRNRITGNLEIQRPKRRGQKKGKRRPSSSMEKTCGIM